MSNVSKAPYERPDEQTLKSRLSAEQFQVTQQCGTEAPFRNAYWDHHEPGIYVDVVSGEPLFASLDKFDSGTGWPSFTRPIDAEHIVRRKDSSHGMQRVEVRSKYGDSHLGHLFDDGPRPTGMRYCINSAALRFVPAGKLFGEGYGKYVPRFEQAGIKTDAPAKEVALLAGGCFWGMEDILRKIPGVLETVVGYSGGSLEDPRYEDITTGKTGHAESVRVVFDPRKLSFEELLGWFFRMHDPTTLNRQGNDVGTQYRSAIFFDGPTQQRVAERVKRQVEASGKWPRPIVTELVAAKPFYPAEAYHQDYLLKNPGGYTCHYLRD